MQLVEQHVIRETDPRYDAVDVAAFVSKNLYNAANYLIRQTCLRDAVYLNLAAVFHLVKHHEAYCALPRKASFLDADPLSVCGAVDIPGFSGRGVKRGLYRAADGRHSNADANGS